MEAINFLSDWIVYLFLVIPLGTGTMITYQAIRKAFSNDASVIDDANHKINVTIKGAILGVTISGIITIIKSFYS